VCVCVSLNVIRCNNNALQLQSVHRVQTKNATKEKNNLSPPFPVPSLLQSSSVTATAQFRHRYGPVPSPLRSSSVNTTVQFRHCYSPVPSPLQFQFRHCYSSSSVTATVTFSRHLSSALCKNPPSCVSFPSHSRDALLFPGFDH
jgi:hypothetical protein